MVGEPKVRGYVDAKQVKNRLTPIADASVRVIDDRAGRVSRTRGTAEA
jgi:hypothetical protein